MDHQSNTLPEASKITPQIRSYYLETFFFIGYFILSFYLKFSLGLNSGLVLGNGLIIGLYLILSRQEKSRLFYGINLLIAVLFGILLFQFPLDNRADIIVIGILLLMIKKAHQSAPANFANNLLNGIKTLCLGLIFLGFIASVLNIFMGEMTRPNSENNDGKFIFDSFLYFILIPLLLIYPLCLNKKPLNPEKTRRFYSFIFRPIYMIVIIILIFYAPFALHNLSHVLFIFTIAECYIMLSVINTIYEAYFSGREQKAYSLFSIIGYGLFLLFYIYINYLFIRYYPDEDPSRTHLIYLFLFIGCMILKVIPKQSWYPFCIGYCVFFALWTQKDYFSEKPVLIERKEDYQGPNHYEFNYRNLTFDAHPYSHIILNLGETKTLKGNPQFKISPYRTLIIQDSENRTLFEKPTRDIIREQMDKCGFTIFNINKQLGNKDISKINHDLARKFFIYETPDFDILISDYVFTRGLKDIDFDENYSLLVEGILIKKGSKLDSTDRP